VLLRRANPVDDPRPPADEILRVGRLSLDPLRLTVAWEGTAVALTVTEFLLLHALARRTGVVKTREQLMTEAYPDRVSVSDRTIDSHIKRIRRKIAAVDPTFAAIESVYGAGYRYLQDRA
jgi:two-component system response regulator ChvI